MIGSDFLDALPVAVYTTDAEGRITYYNEAAADFWGCAPRIGVDLWCGSWRLFWPDGRPLSHDECPMALTLKEGRPVRGIEAIAERPDGTRIRFLPYPTPLRDAEGRLTGAINLLMDVTERHEAEKMSARLAAIVASSDDAIVSKTLAGKITSWNAGASRIFGYEESEMIGQPITKLIPPALHHEEREIIARLKRGERIEHYETVRIAKDGSSIDVSLTVSPLRDRLGNVIGASKVARDVSERKRAEELQRMLLEELNHRVKNTLATIQAIATQSLRRATNPSDFVASFNGRVQALARAHDLLTQKKLHGADVADLVREQVLLDSSDNRIACTGPAVMLDAQAAVHLALVLHELATNARKYGALSAPGGRLSVRWEIQTNGGRNLVLDWDETGGPTVTVPNDRGFGTTLIERTLRAHGGEAAIRYRAEGVSGRIVLPVSAPAGAPYAVQQRAARKPVLHGVKAEASLAGKRIIVIEDEPIVSMDLEATLAAAGCEVEGTAATLAEARRLAASASCDAALLDVNLAGHPVDELAAMLVKRGIPFAFVTGYGPDALPRGFGDIIVLKKPISQDELFSVLRQLTLPLATIVPFRRT